MFPISSTPRLPALLRGLGAAAASLLLAAAAQAQGLALGEAVCGGFPRSDNGPHDYRVVRDRRLSVVEQFHFTPNVERLIRGASSADIGGDLNFTLRAFPNHHRALVAMIRLTERLRTDKPTGSTYTVECWLDRAVRFAPDDTVARMIYAEFLHKRSRTDDALLQMDRVAAVAGDNAFTHYNAGLILTEMKQYDRALAHAHQAYALGFQRADLRDRLQGAGQWKDPPAAAPAAASAAAPTAATPPTPAASAAPPAASAAEAAR